MNQSGHRALGTCWKSIPWAGFSFVKVRSKRLMKNEPLVRHLRFGDFVPGVTILVANVRGQVRPMNGKWPEKLSDNRGKHPQATQTLDVDDHACEGFMKVGLLQTFLRVEAAYYFRSR